MWTVRSNNVPYLEYAADQWNGKSLIHFSFHSCNCLSVLLIQLSVQGNNAWRNNNIICKQLLLISYIPLTWKKIRKIKCLMGEKLSVLNVWITSDPHPASTSRNYFHHLEFEKILLNTLYLSLANKLLIYKTVLKPIWTYGIALWRCASKTNISIIQHYQSKLLRIITTAPWYVSNQTLHTDLRIPYVQSVLLDYSRKHRATLERHPNPLVTPLLHTRHTRRLKRRWTFDNITWGGVVGPPPRNCHVNPHISL